MQRNESGYPSACLIPCLSDLTKTAQVVTCAHLQALPTGSVEDKNKILTVVYRHSWTRSEPFDVLCSRTEACAGQDCNIKVKQAPAAIAEASCYPQGGDRPCMKILAASVPPAPNCEQQWALSQQRSFPLQSSRRINHPCVLPPANECHCWLGFVAPWRSCLYQEFTVSLCKRLFSCVVKAEHAAWL